MDMDKGIRRKRAQVKQAHRMKMLKAHGMQGGTLYACHREKISNSSGYMRDGNVTHYVSLGFRPKTKNKQYGKAKRYSKRDELQRNNQIDQLDELYK